MIFSPLLLGVLFTAKQTPKVSLELRGVRLENAAPILAKTLGFESLAIGPTLTNEVLLVRCKDVEASALKDKIATALNATWENRPEGWRLTQSDEQKAAERKTYDIERYRHFNDLVTTARKRLTAMKPFDENRCREILKQLETLSKTVVTPQNSSFWRKIETIDQEGPANRLAMRIALRLTPDVLMNLTSENPRIVFCNNPNAMQKPFPFPVKDLVDSAFQEQSTWASVAVGSPFKEPASNQDEEDNGYSLGELNRRRKPFKSGDLSTVTLTLDLVHQTCEVACYDQKGKFVIESDISYLSEEGGEESLNFSDEIARIKGKIVKLEGDALEYADLVAPVDPRIYAQVRRKPLSPSLLSKLLQPETSDPLSIAAPDIYLHAIQTPNVVMVMSEDQRVTRLAEFSVPERGTKTYKITDQGGWFLYSPANPVGERKLFADRRKLGNLMRFVSKNQRPLTIEEQASFAYGLPWESDLSYVYDSYLTVLKTNVVGGIGGDRTTLRIYGSLTEGQLKKAKNGGVPLSELSAETKKELFRAIYFSSEYEGNLDLKDIEDPNLEQSKQQNDLMELIWDGIYRDRTFVFPTGLSNNFILTVKDETESQLYCGLMPPPTDQGMSLEGRAMDASSLGSALYREKNPGSLDRFHRMFGRIDQEYIRLATERTVVITMAVSPLITMNWNTNQTLITDPKVYTVKTLPKNILDEMQKAYKAAESDAKEYGILGRPGTGVIPPPQSNR